MKWLEKVKGDCDGIILVHHAHDKVMAFFYLEQEPNVREDWI